jgi:hypothetical protein
MCVCAQFSTFQNVSKHKEAFPRRHMQRTSSWWASSCQLLLASYRARWNRTVRGKMGIACLWLNPPYHLLSPIPPPTFLYPQFLCEAKVIGPLNNRRTNTAAAHSNHHTHTHERLDEVRRRAGRNAVKFQCRHRSSYSFPGPFSYQLTAASASLPGIQ